MARGDALVAVFRGASPLAEIIKTLIEANGVHCVVSVDSGGGEAPAVAWGARVLVLASDEQLARRIINDAEPIAE